MTHSRHVYVRDQGCGALDPPADDGASSVQALVHPQRDQRLGHGLNTTCIEPQDFMARPQDFAAQLDLIARRDFIYSVYSDRPDAVPSPSPDARDHFDHPLSCFYDKKFSQSISPGCSSSHSFFHDSLVSNNTRTFNDCMYDSSMSRPHPIHLVRVEQTGNAMEDVSTDPLQLLVKMRQCGETLEQCFRDRCDKRRRRQLRPERVDLDYPLITYWRQQTEDMQEQTEQMRLEIMQESHAELEDVFFTLYGEGQDGGYRGFQVHPPSPGSGLIHPGLALARPPPILLPVLAEVDETESRLTATDAPSGDYFEGCAYPMEEDNMMGSMDLTVSLSAGLRITPTQLTLLTHTTDSASCPASAFNVTCDMPVNKSSHIVSEAPHLMALWDRCRLAQASNLDTLPRDNSRPQCEFIHCACKVCHLFCTSKGDWKDS